MNLIEIETCFEHYTILLLLLLFVNIYAFILTPLFVNMWTRWVDDVYDNFLFVLWCYVDDGSAVETHFEHKSISYINSW